MQSSGGFLNFATTSDALVAGNSGIAAVAIASTSALYMNGTQVLYFPYEFVGSSLFVGDGGKKLQHTTAFEGYYNTGVGMRNLTNVTTGSYNTGVGFQTLENTSSGSYNTAVGEAAMIYNSTGFSNTAVGWKSLLGTSTPSLNTSSYNTALGYASLFNTMTGIGNTAVGTNALFTNATFGYSTAVGYNSLYNASSSGSVALGFSTLFDQTTGGYNTAVGYNTGLGITTGSYNTIIGSNVTGLSSALANNIIIADGQGNQRINVGATGLVGIGTTTPFRKLSLTDAVSTAQTAIAYDSTRYTDLLTDASGDFVINPSGNDAYFNDDNLWVCSGGSCPAGTPTGNGNLIVETKAGIGNSTPSAYLSVGAAALGGTAASTIFNTHAGSLGTSATNEVALANIGFASSNASSLGVRAYRASAGSDWTTTAIGLGMDVDNTPRAGAQIWLHGNGKVGVGATTTPTEQLSVANNLYVGNGAVTAMGQATSTFQGDIKILGKLDVGTIDPVYTIGGVKYATYGASTIGIREEVVTNIKVDTRVASGEFEYILDFNTLPKGSDLWLFYQITALGDVWDGLVVSLTPSFAGSVHYKKDVEAGRLIITASEAGEVGVRLSAPRYDAQKWSNLRPDQEDPFTHHELEEK